MHCGKHFDKLRPFLEAGGNEVIAPDLPGLGEDKADPRQVTLEMHVAAIVAAAEGAANKPVVLVGHSLAGISISAAAEAQPEAIKRLVFLSAETRPGAPWGETATNPGPEWLSEGLMAFPDGMMAAAEGKEEALAAVFYSGAPPEDIKALAKLLRPQPAYSEEGLTLTDAKFGSVPKVYVKTLQDLVNLPVHQDTWHGRLGDGVPKFELDCGHGSFVSNPEQLADVLKQVAAL